jgi:hypothetical protein
LARIRFTHTRYECHELAHVRSVKRVQLCLKAAYVRSVKRVQLCLKAAYVRSMERVEQFDRDALEFRCRIDHSNLLQVFYPRFTRIKKGPIFAKF